jgi:guanylate kinase
MKNVSLSISYTSRNKRLNELNGKDYFFVKKSKFIELKKKNYFLETAINFENYYGSPYNNISKANRKNKNLLFDIDWKGARKIRKQIHKDNIIDFFILPPSVKELKKRLIKRGRDNKKEINLRLSYALNEISHYNEYSYILVNQNVMKTVNEIMQIIKFNLIIENNEKLISRKIKTLIDF